MPLVNIFHYFFHVTETGYTSTKSVNFRHKLDLQNRRLKHEHLTRLQKCLQMKRIYKNTYRHVASMYAINTTNPITNIYNFSESASKIFLYFAQLKSFGYLHQIINGTHIEASRQAMQMIDAMLTNRYSST